MKVVSSNHAHAKMYLIQHYVIKSVSDLWQVHIPFIDLYIYYMYIYLLWPLYCQYIWLINRIRVMVFTTTFNNIAAILWQSVLFMEETGVCGEHRWPATSHWQTLSHNVVSSTSWYERDSNSQLSSKVF
jgi:hypothetical protein